MATVTVTHACVESVENESGACGDQNLKRLTVDLSSAVDAHIRPINVIGVNYGRTCAPDKFPRLPE